jgi:muconate cycloisomerase
MSDTIAKIIGTEVVVPAREGYVDRPAFGASLFDKHSKWMIEVHTREGLVGYGESRRGLSEQSIKRCAQEVLGKPLLSLSWHAPIPPNLAGNDAYGHPHPPEPYRLHEVDFWAYENLGIEIAIHDLLGKKFGLRLCDLFGGAHRDVVETSWWFGRSDPEHARRQMEIGLKQGFTSLKFKATVDDDVVGIIRAVKEVAGPKLPVVVDPNSRFYHLADSLAIARDLEEFENVMFEDPVPFDIRDWQLFRQKSTIPLALHHGGQPRALVDALREHCCDHVNLEYPAWRFLGDAHMAWRCGLTCWHGSGADLGIIDTYIVQCSAAARNCSLPGDAIGHRIRCDDLIQEELVVRNGAIQVPSGPGLGVTLDHAALNKFGRDKWELTA